MKLLGSHDYRTVPWKNGGGTTLELWAHYDAETPERFVARASIADVKASGPFSKFAGYDRHIVIVEGAGMTLETSAVAGGILALRPWEPVTFDGDWAVNGVVDRGPVRDFNWIVDRARAKTSRLEVRRLAPGAVERLAVSAGELALVHVFRGSIGALSQGGTMVLQGESAELRATGATVLLVGRLDHRS